MARQRRGARKKPALFLSRRRLKQLVVFFVLLAFGVGGGLFLRGRVISVADGDTLTVFTQEGARRRIRLYGVDCPESLQAGGAEATSFTRSEALFADAEIKVMDTDKYGRSVALVILPDGRTLNEELIRNGHAWVYANYCRIPQCAKWRVLEREARINKRGLWASPNPLPPWAWRKKHR